MFTTSDILEIAIQIETNGEQSYRKAAGAGADPSLAAMLAEMADEEHKHRTWFTDLKIRLAIQPVEAAVEEMGRELFQSILGEKAFSLDEVDLARLPDRQALLQISAEWKRTPSPFTKCWNLSWKTGRAGRSWIPSSRRKEST